MATEFDESLDTKEKMVSGQENLVEGASANDADREARILAMQKAKNQKEQKNRQNTMRMLTLISQFGINMLVPIFLCFFVGMFLDRKLGTNYITIILFFVGAIAGFRNVYIFAKKHTKNDSKSEK